MNKSIEIEKRITESKLNMDVYRKMSWERNTNPDKDLPNTLSDKKYKTRQEFIDLLFIKEESE